MADTSIQLTTVHDLPELTPSGEIYATREAFIDAAIKRMGYYPSAYFGDLWMLVADVGYLKALQTLIMNFSPPNTNALAHAVGKGHIHILEWILANCQQIHGLMRLCFDKAAENGQNECLRMMLECGYKFDSAYLLAAKNGHITCICSLLEYNVRMHESTCAVACGGRQLECLKFLIRKNFPKSKSAYFWAKIFDLQECLQVLIDNGFPTCDEDTERDDDVHQSYDDYD